jgi:SAM-dependent methyltransferase
MRTIGRFLGLPTTVGIAARAHRLGTRMSSWSRRFLIENTPFTRDASEPMLLQEDLHRQIGDILTRYRADPAAYKYFYGHPYQGMSIANVWGDRICDYRFDDYELRKWIKPTDTILDIGCNCGFMAVLASYRIGCRSFGVDINPHMIEIGRAVAKHLRVNDLVQLDAGNLKAFSIPPVDCVMSFATHWTDDNNYRVSLGDHMTKMASYLRPGGTLIFETHCADVGRAEFYAEMEQAKALFSFDGMHKRTDAGTRELYIMRKL